MEKYFSPESKLDGFFMGIRTIGKIDAKIDGKIIEIKSKANIPLVVEEVVERYPQDLEQLAFYSVIDPTNPKENYLVFISQDLKQEIKVFKVLIKNKEEIIRILKQRINLLDAVKKGYVNPTKLGKCRYCNKEKCIYFNKGLCKWQDCTFPCEVIDFIAIEEDNNFKGKLLIARARWDGKSEIFRVNDIVSSRKYLYDSALEKIKEEWDEPIEKTLAKDYASNLVYNLCREHGEEIDKIPERKIKEIQNHKGWINLKTSKNQTGKITPYVTGACMTEKEGYLKFFPDYRIAELGIICAIYGKSSGYVFEYLPNLDVKFRVFEVSFNFPEKIIKKVNEIVQVLKSNKIDKFIDLPLCPDFFCKDCSIKEYCGNKSKEAKEQSKPNKK